MTLKGFMSEISQFPNVIVTEKDTYFLFLIVLGNTTAYSIYSDLRKEKPIAYKNVYERVKKLSDLNLIHRQDLKAKRGAITYELTPMGLFFLLKNAPIWSSYLIAYKKSVILEELIFRFFEPRTIRYFDTLTGTVFLYDYLSSTCNEILKKLEEFKPSKRRDKNLDEEVEFIIRKNITKFVHTIITFSSMKRINFIGVNDKGITFDGFDYDIDELPKRMKDNPNYSRFFPVQSLREDQKFISLLRQTKQEFDEGCKQFIL